MILLDTNVVSELMRPSPEPRVAAWVGRAPSVSLFITTVTQAEVLYGLAVLPPSRRRQTLLNAATAMFAEDFRDRILAFDQSAAVAYAEIAANRRRAGRPISQFDAQIAAIAFSRGATLATRNATDFEGCGILIVDPWHARDD